MWPPRLPSAGGKVYGTIKPIVSVNFSQVPFYSLGEHQKVCAYRLVLCPGSNDHCHEMVPFCQVEEHGKMCQDISQWKNSSENSRIFWLPEAMVSMLF